MPTEDSRPDALASLREQFLEAVSAVSEDRWAAGWLVGIEQQLRDEGGLWTVMAAACCGWPRGYLAKDGWDPLTAPELAFVRAAFTR